MKGFLNPGAERSMLLANPSSVSSHHHSFALLPNATETAGDNEAILEKGNRVPRFDRAPNVSIAAPKALSEMDFVD